MMIRVKEPKLLSIEREAAACRKAFKGVKVGAIAMHIHHAELTWLEILTEPPENRIHCILTEKPENERAARLRRFRPLKPSQYRKLPAALREADARWQEADARRQEAYARWQEADARRQEAYARRQEACARWQEAYARWQEADARRQEAYARWQEAYARRQEADALHKEICGCPWSKTTDIFGAVRA